MKGLSALLLFRCFLRSYFVGAAYNPRGLQNIGFLHAIAPGLDALYGQEKALRDARMRYARHYNCHPFLTPVLLGAFLHMESAIAEGRLSPHMLMKLKDTMANTLSGIGDSFFSGTLICAWALSMSIFFSFEAYHAGLCCTLLLFVLIQFFKLGLFIMGYKKGMAFLLFMRQLDLINWSERLKYGNAVLLACFLRLTLPAASGFAWAGVAVFLLAAAWITGKMHIPRVVLAAALLIAVVSLKSLDAIVVLPVCSP